MVEVKINHFDEQTYIRYKSENSVRSGFTVLKTNEIGELQED